MAETRWYEEKVVSSRLLGKPTWLLLRTNN
jgi:hypothetical protein